MKRLFLDLCFDFWSAQLFLLESFGCLVEEKSRAEFWSSKAPASLFGSSQFPWQKNLGRAIFQRNFLGQAIVQSGKIDDRIPEATRRVVRPLVYRPGIARLFDSLPVFYRLFFKTKIIKQKKCTVELMTTDTMAEEENPKQETTVTRTRFWPKTSGLHVESLSELGKANCALILPVLKTTTWHKQQSDCLG